MQPKKKWLTRPHNVFRVLSTSSLPDYGEREMLLAHILQVSRETLIAHPEKKVAFRKRIHFWYLQKQRLQGVPIAYLTKEKAFYGRSFFVTKSVLIPRPETELLIEQALTFLKKHPNTLVFDVGSGSGCIPITLAKETHGLQIWGTDISLKAIRIARINAKKHSLSLPFLRGNLLSPVKKILLSERTSQEILITANLPYVPKQLWQEEASIHHEPILALVSGADGLDLYRTFVTNLFSLSKDFPHHSITAIIEMLQSQEDTFVTFVREQEKTGAEKIIVDTQVRRDSCGNISIITLHLLRT